jgi:uncharacterized membrane protein YfhO
VDGVEAPVERVDGVFQGVYLVPGQHAVRLSFAPRSLKDGLLAAGAALTLGVVALGAEWLTDRWRR